MQSQIPAGGLRTDSHQVMLFDTFLGGDRNCKKHTTLVLALSYRAEKPGKFWPTLCPKAIGERLTKMAVL